MKKNLFSQNKKNYPENPNNKELLSDRYGVDKTPIYQKEEPPKENKFLGAAVILFILLFLIIIAIIINIGR